MVFLTFSFLPNIEEELKNIKKSITLLVILRLEKHVKFINVQGRQEKQPSHLK